MADATRASNILDRSGLRPTKARSEVLEALLGAGRSLSHAELAEILPGLDKVTVFRSLKTLRDSGLLHSVRSLDGVLRYVVNPSGVKGCPGSHPHFLCLDCGTLNCLEGQELPRIDVPVGAEVRGKQFLVYGTCAACARAARNPARHPVGRSSKTGK